MELTALGLSVAIVYNSQRAIIRVIDFHRKKREDEELIPHTEYWLSEIFAGGCYRRRYLFDMEIRPGEMNSARFLEPRRVYDEAGVLDKEDVRTFENYTKWIFRESDIDIWFVFVKNMRDKTIEEFAVEKVQELGIEGKSREERGVLLLFDLAGKRLRVSGAWRNTM